MSFVNLTPHNLNIVSAAGEVFVIPPSGEVARVTSTSVVTEILAGYEVFKTSYGEVTGLPEPRPGAVFIVAGMVLARPELAHRRDLVAPGRLIRHPKEHPTHPGQVIGARGLRRN